MNNKKKHNLDDVNLVQALSDIVNTDKLSELEYETDLCKIKIVKHSNPIFSNVPSIEHQTINTVPVEKENKTIIETLKEYKIISWADRKNIGIWIKQNKKLKKIAAMGIRVKKWIAYHGFSINIKVNLKKYEKIVPCGIKNMDPINLYSIKRGRYKNLGIKLTKNIINNLKI